MKMKRTCFRSLLLVIISANIVDGYWWYLSSGGRHICTEYYYGQQKYHVDCGFWSWQACTRYRDVLKSHLKCCTGYSNDRYLSDCPYAICDGKIKDKACTIHYPNDKIIYRPGVSTDSGETNSGGKCIAPNTCNCPKDGFYADGPYCKICPKIPNCLHRRCNSISSNRCEYCDGEIIHEKKYWRAYIRGINGKYKQCVKACSWRADSTRCYPGSCPDHDIATSCKCIDGFGGHHCDKIIKNSTISYAIASLKGPKDTSDPVETPKDPSDPIPRETTWTNQNLIKKAYLKVTAVFKSSEAPPAPDLTGRNHFVTEFSYGITRGELRLNLIRENMTVPPIVKPCITKNALPTTEQFDCEEQQAYFFQHNWENHVTSFEHNDQVIFSLSITNGGSLKYIDRDKYRSPEPPTPRIPVTIQGRTVFRQFTFHWDLHKPFQLCVRQYSLNCTKPPVYATDVTNNSEITLHWNGWADDLARIGGYEYEVYKLGNDGTFQSEDQGKLITTGKNISTLDTSATFKVIDTGMYSVIFFAIDKAGNMKPARTLFLYDDSSHVEMNNGTTMKVEQARKDTNYVWVDVDSPVLKVKWPGRFKNEEHYKQLWLASVKPRKHVDPEYDDHYGKRKTTTVPHRQGIVRFETQFTVLSPAITQQVNFVSTSDVRDEATSLSVTWNDGDRLDVTVRAYDIFDIFIDDVVTVFKDTSSPKIENLWLSNGDRVNVSVHSFEDFSKMTVEWNAFDYHSGIDNLEWRLYDNYTKTDIVHGHANLHSQGNSENITDCQNKYGDAPRGPSCYCTSFHGCFHKHFYVKPKINKLSGLITGKDKGVHDSDYYIEVTVVNKALLKTTVVKKITIDVSPPHEGYVHDGIRGDPEIDFQQDLHIDAHWEGFFDRESGVEFYQYIFSDHCFNNDEFKANNETTETYNTFASFEASTEGTYFVSVVAVNRAKENSNVVCSDGVTIMTTMPYIKDFLMSGAKTKPRLLRDNDGNIWFLDNMLQRHFVENITSSCIVSNLENVTMLPLGKPVSQNAVRLCGINNNLHILAVVSKEIQFKMSWNPAIDANLIHDYEVGLSSTASSIAPDIVSFRTTKHHTHFRLNHPDVPDGKEFYIIIKSISKSGVEGLQSIGPFIVDTTKPRFSGSNIDVNLINDFLIANWTADAFEDPDDPYPMYFKYAVGHRPNMYDIQSFQNLQIGGPCKRNVPATCTALSVSHLKWSLHGHHDYYFTIKATNLAGLSVIQTSLRYTHDIQLPAEGIVMDVIPTSNLQNEAKDIEDRDFTPETTSLAVRWTGFIHPHQHVNYSACIGTVPSTCDTSAMKTLETYNSYTFKGLNLQPFQKYYVTLEAGTTGGSVKVSSDGIRVLDIHTNLTGIVIRDGNNCSVAPDLKLSHHSKDTRPTCVEDVEFQSSTTSLHVYWSIPSMYTEYLRDAFVQLEERVFGDIWKEYRKFQYVGKHQYITLSNLDLEPGKTYRAVVKFCAEDLCFSPVYGNGITVIVNPPSSGNITVQQVDEPNHHQLTVTFERMYDPDIKDHTEAQSVIHYYEWALGDNVGIHTIWNEIDNATVVDKEHIQFVVPLNNSLDFSKCRQIFIRGYNKAGIWSTISTEIKTCNVNDGDSLIVSNSVIDAIGIQEKTMDGTKRDGYGHDIYLEENGRWDESDVDYTPYKNIISGVWPLLRHKNYTWAVIDSENLDITSYYKDDAKLQLKDPCSHPDSIKCGFTDKEYVNIIFNVNEELEHGKRYIVCIHAPRTEIQFEKWTEVLEETNTCSDGVTVDLTPPTPGHVWIGIDPDKKYQSSSSDIFVSWDAFTDVEEYKKTVHNSGIKEYQIGIGSTKGGTDVFPYTIVGLVNHYTIHDVRLQNGHEYYATVKALDFATRSAIADSHPVKIDGTPPEKSDKPITIEGRHMSDMSEINACWRDVFIDKDSGIDHYLWSVGSHPGHDDIIPFTKTTLDCGVSAEDTNINIHEGHAYFITVKAVNRANLISTSSSWAYIYDMSPPVAGHVYDGSVESALSYMKDRDYQTDVKTLSAYWEGYHDPHSTIKSYYVSIGTCPECEDLLVNQDIGITYNYTLCHMHLGSGIRYYTTITACNTADMCTSVTSDGVVIDNSPPTQGIVRDGVDVYDLEYQSLRCYLSARWYGFTDPQSGIDKFSWRAGTKPGQDDIVKSTHLPQTDLLVEPDLPQKLPLGQRIYITIKAYNKAGLTTEATSNGFYIDNSPPSIKVKPYLSADVGSIKDTSVVFRSTIKIQWEVEDKESFIQRQYLSIASHKGGEFNTSSTELNGIVREYTFSQLDLHDGGNYTIKLIVCNGAKVCVEDESRGIIVDSSPPTPGMFAIRTDHAANLHRHVDGWMTWSRYKLWISWLGFTDLHTGIEKYSVSIGSKYMMDDFNKISGSPQEFLHNQSGIDKHDEGFVQTFEVDTKNLAKFENVFVSVWAVNQIGLQSKMIHSQFKLVPGGSLELIRRCSAVTCQGHCVCAAQGQRCTKRSCHDVTKANNNNLLGIYDITNIQESSPFTDIKYTPSNVALAAKWHVIQAQGLRPLWYEWTAGYSDKDEPEGIFDNLNDDVWHHAGQTNRAILNIKRGQRLKESPVSYSMFIRAWYNDDTYADFKTDGILVMSTPLPRRKIKGSAVVEQIPGHWKKDVDYLKPGAPFTVKWTNVFKDDANIIAKFKVYLSTYPGGHDIHEVELDLPGSVTSHNISRVPLSPGKVFYSNVVGYSYSGIHATETSDGIMVDSQPPLTGTVYDGIGMHDTEYQNNSKLVGASWHGFSDRDSGITNYMWCVQTKSATVPCDIKDWENVGIHHSVSRVINSSHIHTGEEVESLVYGLDGIGYRSQTSKSNGVMIDTTHPEPTLMEHLDQNIAANPSFEDINGQAIDWDNITNVNFCNNVVYALQWNNSLGSCVGVLKSGKNVAIDGRSFIFVEGQISQSLENLNVGLLYRVTFVTAHPPILGAVLANKEGYIEFGNSRHVFMVYTKQDKHGSASKELNWHHHTFYFRPSTTTETIIFGSMTGNTGILFDDVKIQETILHNHDEVNKNGKHIHAHVVALHQWSSIHASWSFVDPESPIVDFMWAIGYTEGSTEVQGFTSVGLNNFAYNYNVSLAHTSVIHITVVATNAAGLRKEAHAEDLLVDLTAPDINFVNDGIGSDIDAQTTEEVSANWEVHDAESGIDVCEWAVGYQPYGNEIQTFQPLASGVKIISKVFPSSQVSMQMIHVTLRCKNEAGLQSSKSSNGVKISSLPPNTTSAEVQILPHTLTEYNPRYHYQGDTSSIRVKWTGFEDLTGLDSYLLTLQSHDKSTLISKSIIAENQDMSFCLLEGLDISNGNYSASVNAVNKMYLRSTQVSSQIVISQKTPLLIENPNLLMDLNNRTITASWKDHFQVQQPIYYEVSAGTILGGADIIQWQETKNTFLEFQLPPKIKSVKALTGYISVRGVSANGMTTSVNAAVKL